MGVYTANGCKIFFALYWERLKFLTGNRKDETIGGGNALKILSNTQTKKILYEIDDSVLIVSLLFLEDYICKHLFVSF